MRRITLGGPELADFPQDQSSAYIKLMLPDGDQTLMRTYTIRAQRTDSNEMDVDFMMHGDDSPASAWASKASAGDSIAISGPGGKKLLDYSADWFLLAGDMTALPAISVNIEQLPADARGYAVIEVIDESDIQALHTPDNFIIHWVINPQPGSEQSPILEKIQQLAWQEGRPSIWAACEFTTMRALRRYFKQEMMVGKRELYVSSYWKKGISEDQHKKVKRADANLEESNG
jgi:NADPH-dependent ferric siderophore reductase